MADLNETKGKLRASSHSKKIAFFQKTSRDECIAFLLEYVPIYSLVSYLVLIGQVVTFKQKVMIFIFFFPISLIVIYIAAFSLKFFWIGIKLLIGK